MIAGLLMAVGCALAGSVGMLLKHRGTVAAPNVLARHPLRRLFAGKAFGKSIAAASRSCGDRQVSGVPGGQHGRARRVCVNPYGSAYGLRYRLG
jgi:hypothetical protein